MILGGVGLTDLLDMAVVAVFIYALLVWFKKTRAAFVAIGLMVLAAVYVLAQILGLTMTVKILQGFFAVSVIAVIVIFQEELRHLFERIAVWSLRGGDESQPMPARQVEIIARVSAALARDKIGALIVLRGQDPLDRHVRGGWELQGLLSEALLESIFDWHSLGHDGAVVIENGRVEKFGCHLPLPQEPQEDKSLGTRHMAALGLSERSDALCVVVSEEKGTISLARGGSIEAVSGEKKLYSAIETFLAEKHPQHSVRRQFLRRNTEEKIIAVLISAALWLFFVKYGNRFH